jgi:ABC-type sugar transport system permease subunit
MDHPALGGGITALSRVPRDFGKYRHCYLWIAPFFILFGVFSVYPAGYGFYVSLTNYDGFTGARFVGLKNYGALLGDPLFWKSLGNTLALWLFIVPLRTSLALVFASVLNSSRLLGKRLYMVVVLLPYVTAIMTVAHVFRMFLATQGGVVNMILARAGIPAVGWLDTVEMSKVSIAVMNIWRMTGYFTIVMLAALQKISSSINEAAELDGAGPFRKFFGITLPLMVPEIFFVALISTIWVLQNMGDVMVLTRGGPLNSSINLVYYIYRNAFEYSKVGYASAMSYVLFIILLGLSVFSLRGQFKTGRGKQ